jgi:polysaccharide export outer membrane protein
MTRSGIAKLIFLSAFLVAAYFVFDDSNELLTTEVTNSDPNIVLTGHAANDDDGGKAKPLPQVSLAVFESDSAVVSNDGLIIDDQIHLCQASCCPTCSSTQGCGCDGRVVVGASYGPTMNYGTDVGYAGGGNYGRNMLAVDQNSGGIGREARWRDSRMIPWEEFAYGEYIGPHRTPHVPQYRIRVGDQLEFVYLLTRERSAMPYRLFVGDTIQISSSGDEALNQTEISILSDGTVSVALIGQVRVAGKTVKDVQRELNDRYSKFVKNPAIVVSVTTSETPLNDLRDAVDARQGAGGQSRQALVSPDGTVQLPMIGSVPAVGLTLEEIGREINARYGMKIRGIEVTPILLERAARFIYVVGEVSQPGRFELVGPTTAIQSLALAQGFLEGGNLRQIVVLRRDSNWRLVATKIDLAGAMYGRRPMPSDEIWLRHDDIVIVPKKPVQRLSEAVNQYFTQTLYGLFPAQLGSFDAAPFIQ